MGIETKNNMNLAFATRLPVTVTILSADLPFNFKLIAVICGASFMYDDLYRYCSACDGIGFPSN